MSSEPPKKRDPHRALYTLHRVFVVSSILLGLILVVWATTTADDGSTQTSASVFGGLLVLGGALYLRWFVRKTRSNERP